MPAAGESKQDTITCPFPGDRHLNKCDKYNRNNYNWLGIPSVCVGGDRQKEVKEGVIH